MPDEHGSFGHDDEEFSPAEIEAARLLDQYQRATRGQACKTAATTVEAVRAMRDCPKSERQGLQDAIDGVHFFRRAYPESKG